MEEAQNIRVPRMAVKESMTSWRLATRPVVQEVRSGGQKEIFRCEHWLYLLVYFDERSSWDLVERRRRDSDAKLRAMHLPCDGLWNQFHASSYLSSSCECCCDVLRCAAMCCDPMRWWNLPVEALQKPVVAVQRLPCACVCCDLLPPLFLPLLAFLSGSAR